MRSVIVLWRTGIHFKNRQDHVLTHAALMEAEARTLLLDLSPLDMKTTRDIWGRNSFSSLSVRLSASSKNKSQTEQFFRLLSTKNILRVQQQAAAQPEQAFASQVYTLFGSNAPVPKVNEDVRSLELDWIWRLNLCCDSVHSLHQNASWVIWSRH